MAIFSRPKRNKPANGTLPEGNATADIVVPPDPEKEVGTYDDQPVRFLTPWSLSMGVLVSMGGFIFGYDTGQISGFLAMKDFLQRFGQKSADGSYAFSDVRSGLIVGLV